jgi:dihydroneopterin aldolase
MGQKFIVSAMLALDLRKAGATDDLKHTVNYAEVFRCDHRSSVGTGLVMRCMRVGALSI